MLRTLKPATWMAIVLIGFTGLAGIAWQNNPVTSRNQQQQDTLPKKDEKTVINGDLDKAIDEVNRAKENLEKQLQNKDWEKMHRDLQESFEKINAEKMQEQIAKAMKQIDMQKIQLQAQAALKQIDWQKMQAEIEKAQAEMKKTDLVKMQKEMQHAMEETKKAMAEMKAVDMEKIQRELEQAKENLQLNESMIKEEIERARNDIKQNLGKDFRKELEKAREDVNRAAEELQNYKDMLTEMDAAGLLNAHEPYSIEYKKGELIINGKKQPDTITNKYKHYFKKENVQIKKGKEDKDNRTIDL
jgi:DNA repair exonuclease SbcCD ATPase subunit